MTILQKFKKNEHGSDYVVGDIHGEYQKLMSQLDEIGFNKEKDRLFAVGDIIDRGEDSLGCLHLVYEPWFFSVLGNHEDLMINGLLYHNKTYLHTWFTNGGDWFFDLEEEQVKALQEEIPTLIDLFPLAIEVETDTGNIGIIHAEAPALWHHDMIRDLRMKCLWGRERFDNHRRFNVMGIDRVYSGHCPTFNEKPVDFEGNIHYIDSGAVFTGKKLCIVKL